MRILSICTLFVSWYWNKFLDQFFLVLFVSNKFYMSMWSGGQFTETEDLFLSFKQVDVYADHHLFRGMLSLSA